MKAIILSFVFIGLGFTTYAQIGIGTTNPAATAALDIESTTKGLLIPRLTQTQRNAIASYWLNDFLYRLCSTRTASIL